MRDDAAPTPPIRILLAALPGLRASVVKSAIATQMDMQIVAEVRGQGAGDPVAASVDVVVTTSADSGVPGGYRRLLFDARHVPLVVLSPDGDRVEAYVRRVVREVSLTELVAVIREAARARLLEAGIDGS